MQQIASEIEEEIYNFADKKESTKNYRDKVNATKIRIKVIFWFFF